MSGIFLFSMKSVCVAITKVGRENFVEKSVCVATTKVGRENLVEIVMGLGMLVRMGAPVILFPKSVALFPTLL